MEVRLLLSWRSFTKNWWRAAHLRFSQQVGAASEQMTP